MKVLIFRKENLLKPVGGPNGYLFNLKKGMDASSSHDVEISFLPSGFENKTVKNKAKQSKSLFVKKMLSFYRRYKHIRRMLSCLGKCYKSPVKLTDFEIIHFHTTMDMYGVRKELEQYRGKVILTSHSPQPLSNEIIDGCSKFEKFLFGKRLSRLIQMDEYAFKHADYIVFPCEFADVPYLHAWPEYQKIKNEKIKQYRYLLTGTVAAQAKKSRLQVRKEFGIPEDAFLISYVGRHNEIKGYDKLKEICVEYLDINPNAYVIVAGNAGPLFPPKHSRWIEVGWTNDPHSIIAASDVFVLPNKETYFDLVLLEVLSLGKCVIASRTGGNKYFEKYGSDAIKLYSSQEECLELIDANSKITEEKRAELEYQTKEIFEKDYTTEQFAKNYINLIKHLD